MTESREAKRRRIETFEYLAARLTYDPNTGILIWTILFPGRRAGAITSDGYRKLALERLDFKAHRIAWVLYYGHRPEDGFSIDHINGQRDDNRIENLRLCRQSENGANSRTPKSNSTGYKGVSVAYGARYRAYINVNRRHIHLGIYSTSQAAARAYNEAALRYFGAFARLNQV